jgi:hypothetical protein
MTKIMLGDYLVLMIELYFEHFAAHTGSEWLASTLEQPSLSGILSEWVNVCPVSGHPQDLLFEVLQFLHRWSS